jgi:hypothetical protein
MWLSRAVWRVELAVSLWIKSQAKALGYVPSGYTLR